PEYVLLEALERFDVRVRTRETQAHRVHAQVGDAVHRAPSSDLPGTLLRGSLGERHTRLDAERGGIAPRFPDEAVEPVDRLLAGGTRAETRQSDPTVGETGRAANDHLAIASHPDGNGPLDRQWPNAGIRYAMPLSVVGHQLSGPEEPHDLELLLD